MIAIFKQISGGGPLIQALDAIISLRFGNFSHHRNRCIWQVEPARQCSFSLCSNRAIPL